ncbi:MAG: hypothetical protein LBI03_10665 [Clostridiales bacterium]|jgi:hypothetical protein|nr:hypothetical protein [Clostridiales bacterium]
MNFGFSYVGLIFLLMLTIPNLIWTKHQPSGYSAKHENRLLVLCERFGQAIVTVTALAFKDFNLKPFSLWSLWLIISFILMLLYECWWIRYFTGEKALKDFYSSFLGVPVAGATLPVISFLLLGVYGKNPILVISAAILGIGHIGIHLQHKKELN